MTSEKRSPGHMAPPCKTLPHGNGWGHQQWNWICRQFY